MRALICVTLAATFSQEEAENRSGLVQLGEREGAIVACGPKPKSQSRILMTGKKFGEDLGGGER